MENEEKIRIDTLEKRTNRLESVYIVYSGSATAENRSHWKTEWYRVLYGISDKE